MKRGLSPSVVSLVVSLGALTACGAPPRPAVSAFSAPPPSDDRLEAKLPGAPMAFRSFAFDYGALPTLDPVSVDEKLPDASFAIARQGGGLSLVMTDDLMADVRIDDQRFSRAMGPGAPAQVTPLSAVGIACGAHRTGRASWQGLVRSTSPDEVTFLCYEGQFDYLSCTAEARRAWRVRAPRLAEGGVFGFRASGTLCGAGNEAEARGERLEVIGPSPTWVGSSDPGSVAKPRPGAFSRVSIPVQKGSSASAVLDVSPTDLLSPVRLAPAGVTSLSYSFEILWPEGRAAPSATAFVSALRGDPALVAPSNAQYSFSDG